MEPGRSSAIVTGAASGLGAASAAALAAHGATVIGLDLADSIDKPVPPPGVRLVSADVTSEAEVRAALDTLSDEQPLRIAVNCAGIAPAQRILSSRGPHDLGLFRSTVEVNLVDTFNVLRLAAERIAAAPPDAQGQRGVIVNTASVAAFEGQIGQAAYAASKGGVASLTIQAARDLARNGIRVNTIAPGIVDTPMMASLSEEVRQGLAESVVFPQRLAAPGEYAKMVLAIIDNDYLNGETIRLDGAIRMGPR
ncbi:SDR family NAD(P)-dependent oxidoreductase [Leucobacter massiliensis]|uniref:3-hydroxyacyl-CoA dehydrogenase n=1 Tax=Leucobacter massiliensis TaxID=1686285 RepID=A0A2S9QRY5_9MICO|nr:SDR family NAD(P)-dependent oxidoreductase [Leucobacter massiliensis]PRI12357.1 3-hydroxyacyl-CoA dehydrogenase [Leucobacter massiliensis]